MGAFIDLTDQKFGRLTVIKRDKRDGVPHWICRCKCGTIKSIGGPHLRRGSTISCGCQSRERIAKLNLTHGQSGVETKTAEYRIWSNMRSRCGNPNVPAFKDYGARGILVCRRWDRFENFLADMGKRPSLSHSLDRKNNNRGYSPANCRWATKKQQARNSRANRIVTYRGRRMPLSQASELAGAKYGTVWWRVKNGWPLAAALGGHRG